MTGAAEVNDENGDERVAGSWQQTTGAAEESPFQEGQSAEGLAGPRDSTVAGHFGNESAGVRADYGQTFPRPWRHPLRFLARVARLTGTVIKTGFSLVSLLLVLAVLAAIPLVNFYVLGYFLNVEARIARSGRWREAFPFLKHATRLVTIVAGVWLSLLPLRFLAGLVADARLIDPGSPQTRGLHLVLNVAWFVITVHLLLALARGGSFVCFLRPFKNFFWLRRQLADGGYWSRADEQIRQFVSELQPRQHFWLGLRGFCAVLAWLVLPTALFAAANGSEEGQGLLVIIGGVLLTVVLSWAPFLQAHLAVENRFGAAFQLREVRNLYRHAPLVWSLSLVVLYLLSLPLYLFKAILLPLDAMWPVTLIFVATILPTRVLLGWAYYWAARKRDRDRKSHWTVRWLCGGALLALLGFYVFLLYFTQFLGEQGKLVLFHHHSLLLPAPFQGTLGN